MSAPLYLLYKAYRALRSPFHRNGDCYNLNNALALHVKKVECAVASLNGGKNLTFVFLLFSEMKLPPQLLR